MNSTQHTTWYTGYAQRTVPPSFWIVGKSQSIASSQSMLHKLLSTDWAGCLRRRSSELTSTNDIITKTNKHKAKERSRNCAPLFCLHITKLNTIFSHSWAWINLWQYNWRPMLGVHCLVRLTKEIGLVSNCKYPPGNSICLFWSGLPAVSELWDTLAPGFWWERSAA